MNSPAERVDRTPGEKTLSAGFAGSRRGSDEGMVLIDLLVTDAGRRIRLFSGIGIGVFALGIPLALFLAPANGSLDATRFVMPALCALLLVFSILVFAFARRRNVTSRALVRVGLVYVVVAAGAMAGAETILSAARSPQWDGVSGICVWIVLFPLIIPCRPRYALITSLSSATMLPLFYLLQLPFDGTRVSGETLVTWWGPVYFCAGLSFAAALSIHRAAARLSSARSAVSGAGRYELVEKLSEGGMGEVWRARHRFLPHDVAVKLIRPTAQRAASPSMVDELVARFRMEAHAVAQLRSPSTVRLFDYGVGDDGELFAVMEYLDGFDLQALVEKFGVLPPARVIPMLHQVCLSLAEAHEKGLVHRDIKPANLMLCRLGCQSDLIKVLDFGLVGALGQSARPSSGAAGETVSGTPGYIAPEVLRGARADARSDIYAVGVVAYWLLTGTTLFPREGGGEDIGRHLSDTPADPSERRGEHLPRDLSDLVLRLVARDPDDRPRSVQELRHALHACASSGAWTEDDADRWWGEHGAG